MPHYTVGILDEFFAVKPGDTIEKIRQYIDENVLLLDYDGGESINRAYWEETDFEADVILSLYGEKPLRNGRLTWALSKEGETLCRDEITVDEFANGFAKKIHSLKLTWPWVEETAKLNLSTRLIGSGYDIYNDWDFWVFPKLSAPAARARCARASSVSGLPLQKLRTR